MRLRTPSPPPGYASRGATDLGVAPRDGVLRLPSRRRSRSRLLLALLAVTVLVLGGVWVVGFSSVLAAQRVEVVAAGPGERVPAVLRSDVLAVAEVPIGEPLMRVSTDQVAARVELVPEVASAKVSRSWPSTVTVAVQARTPVAVVVPPSAPGGATAPAPGAVWQLVDAEGAVFGEVSAEDLKGGDLGALPLVRGLNLQPREVQDDVAVTGLPDEVARRAAADPPRTPLGAGAAVAATLPAGLLDQLVAIEANGPMEVRLVLTDGRVIVWGGPELAPEKARVLELLLGQPGSRYDVTVPSRPTVLP